MLNRTVNKVFLGFAITAIFLISFAAGAHLRSNYNTTYYKVISCEGECPICCGAFTKCAKLPCCGQIVCRSCANKWICECRNGTRYDTETDVDELVIHMEERAKPRYPTCVFCRQEMVMPQNG